MPQKALVLDLYIMTEHERDLSVKKQNSSKSQHMFLDQEIS